MDYNAVEVIKCIYQKDDTTKSKVEEMCESSQALKRHEKDDLAIFFNYTVNELPIIKGVEVETTNYNGSGNKYIMITQMPELILSDVQKTIMRIMGCQENFTCERWAIGGAKSSDSIRKHLEEYLKAHSEIRPIPGEEAGYPKVFMFDCNEVAAAHNRSYVVTEMTGLVLS